MEKLNVIRDLEGLKDLEEYLYDKEYIAFDTETTGLVKGSEVIGLSVCADPDEGFYVVLAEWSVEEQKLNYLETKGAVFYLLESLKGKKLIMQNAPFDCRTVYDNFSTELMPSVFHDTLVSGHLLNENRRNGLKERGEELFGDSAKKEAIEMRASIVKNGGQCSKKCYELFKADSELIALYGAKDAILTLKVFYNDAVELVEQGLDKFFYDEESMPLLRGPTYDLITTGLCVDQDKLIKLKGELEAECVEAKAFVHSEIWSMIKDKYPGTTKRNTFNIGANQQLAWLLFEVMGEEFSALTNVGKEVCQALNIKLPYAPRVKREFIGTVRASKGFVWDPPRRVRDKKIGEMKETKAKTVGDFWIYLSTGKATMEKLAPKHPWVQKLLEYKKAEKILNTYVIGIQERQAYGIIRPDFKQCGTTSGRYSCSNPNFQNLPRDDKRVKACIVARPGKVFVGADYCLHPESEILTPTGWKNILQVKLSDKVWQVNKTTLTGEFVTPIRVISREYIGAMNFIGNKRGHLAVTDKHTMLYSGQNHSSRPSIANRRVEALSNHGIPGQALALIPYSVSDTKSDHTKEEIWRACALQADGSKLNQPDRYRIQVSIARKREKLTFLFGEGKAAGYIRECHTLETETWRVTFKSSLLTENKSLDLSSLGSEHADTLVEALCFWDGSRPKDSPNRVKFYSADKNTLDSVQCYLVKSGYEASLSQPSKHSVYTLSIRKHSRVRLVPKTDHKTFTFEGQVGCVTVPSGFILVRYKGFVAVTGNCQLEPRVFASISQDRSLLECFKNEEDFYSVIGAKAFHVGGELSLNKDAPNSFAKKYPELRQIAKVIALAVTYGTTPHKLAPMLGKSIDDCKDIVNNYLESFPGVKQLMDDSHAMIKRDGQVKNIFGRPRRMPLALEITTIYGNARHSDLPYEARKMLNLATNHRIQSTAASVMNRAAIEAWKLIHELAQEAVLWQEVRICLQVHDEVILEGPAELAEEMKAVLKEAMENTVALPGVALVAKPVIANNLADLK